MWPLLPLTARPLGACAVLPNWPGAVTLVEQHAVSGPIHPSHPQVASPLKLGDIGHKPPVRRHRGVELVLGFGRPDPEAKLARSVGSHLPQVMFAAHLGAVHDPRAVRGEHRVAPPGERMGRRVGFSWIKAQDFLCPLFDMTHKDELVAVWREDRVPVHGAGRQDAWCASAWGLKEKAHRRARIGDSDRAVDQASVAGEGRRGCKNVGGCQGLELVAAEIEQHELHGVFPALPEQQLLTPRRVGDGLRPFGCLGEQVDLARARIEQREMPREIRKLRVHVLAENPLQFVEVQKSARRVRTLAVGLVDDLGTPLRFVRRPVQKRHRTLGQLLGANTSGARTRKKQSNRRDRGRGTLGRDHGTAATSRLPRKFPVRASRWNTPWPITLPPNTAMTMWSAEGKGKSERSANSWSISEK